MGENISRHTLRPAGRHVLAIGKGLIKDTYSAVMELVKNAYDADSPDVKISFSLSEDRDVIRIVVEDSGHGMTKDVVVNKWLIPSTNDKLLRKKSPKGRYMQGQKGIGRYAAAILGNNLRMETVTESGETSELSIDWDDYESAKFMDDVLIEIKSSVSEMKHGTKVFMEGGGEYASIWDRRQISRLEYELKKLISPVHEDGGVGEFKISLSCQNLFDDPSLDFNKEIEPFPIVEFYDYKISGKISSDGKGELAYTNNKVKASQNEIIKFDYLGPTNCGEIDIDVRVYDRESESIDNLIRKGLKGDDGNYLNKTQAKKLLNESNGIGVYRNGFRVRPLGDPDFDWLKLNDKRVQNPSMCVGSNQVIGFVRVQSEEFSSLIEKSARDGLKENKAYEDLIVVVGEVISRLQERRFAYRRKAGLSRVAIKIERDFERLFSFDDIKFSIRKKLINEGVGSAAADEVLELLQQKEDDSAKLVENIRQKVAVYEGQATLGKIINVILHEGRKPLGYFKNQIVNLKFWLDEFRKNPSEDLINEIESLTRGIADNAKIFVDLFGRLDPLSTSRRGKRKNFLLKDIINKSIAIFEGELAENGILARVSCSENIEFLGWESDFYVIFGNLLDNSIFWMLEKKSDVKKIIINVSIDGKEGLLVDYRDSGPGIDDKLIEDNLIFEPEFTTKTGGSGIGLALAGEAASRNGLELKAFSSDKGAFFRLQCMEESK